MPRSHIPNPLRREVKMRASERCEYCLIHQEDRPEAHQIDHVMALKHGGATESQNLALACAVCNKNKGSDLASIDPLERRLAPLFNPRAHHWQEHFRLEQSQIIGLTSIGRATVELLRLNDEKRLVEREELIMVGRYPTI